MTDNSTDVEALKERLRYQLVGPWAPRSTAIVVLPSLLDQALATITDLQAKLKAHSGSCSACHENAAELCCYCHPFGVDVTLYKRQADDLHLKISTALAEKSTLEAKLADVTRERDEARDALRQLSKFAVLSGSRYIMVAHELSSEVTALLTAQNSALHLPPSDVCHQPDGRLSGGDEPAPYSLSVECRLALAKKVVEAVRDVFTHPWKSLDVARQALAAYDAATKDQPETEGEG